MTVGGDLWVVCIDCTPNHDTFLSKGRRVSWQVLLTLAHRFVLFLGTGQSVRISFGLWGFRGVTTRCLLISLSLGL